MLFHYPIREYYFYSDAVDMRKGIDSLVGIVRSSMSDPLSGTLFIFLNKRRTQIKMLHWQGDGFAVFYKRLERGTYESVNGGIIKSEQLLFLLQGVVIKSIRKHKRYSQSVVIK